ncbi:MAG: hypothetical protein HDS02_03755 [Bacteroides sp.]|nr:hypothetical protein [Bacteroides sp.]
MEMTIKTAKAEVLSTFPFAGNISKDSLEEIINIALGRKLYFQSTKIIYSLTKDLNPPPVKVDFTDGSEYDKWWNWRHEVWKWLNDQYFPLWKRINGEVRTIEAACELCANIWMNKIFKISLQDNGAWNDGYVGAMMNAFGSMLKTDAMSEVSEEMKDKAKEGIKNFYLRNKYRYDLGCDYDPCTELYNILLEAGVPKNEIRNICPWKTYIKIMPEDNSVLVHTYQKDEYV